MIDPEVVKVLESSWVQNKRDKNGEETWGWELKEGAPEDVKKAFEDFLEAQSFEDSMHGYK